MNIKVSGKLVNDPYALKSWLMAARPKTLTAAIIPVLVGTMLAKGIAQPMNWMLMWAGIMSVICIQIGTNLINDALDFKKGADTAARLGPQRVTQSGLLTMNQVFSAGLIFFSLAVLFALPLIQAGGIPIFLITILSVCCGYLYTGGPKPLAYCGLGDLFVLLFFGLIGTSAMYYVQTGFVDAKSLVAGLQIGLLAVVLIAINNLRDHQGDSNVNKRTLAVRFGITFGRWEITLMALLPFVLNLFWIKENQWLAAFLPFLTLPLAFLIVQSIWKHKPGAIYNQFLGFAALLHLSFGLLLAIGLY